MFTLMNINLFLAGYVLPAVIMYLLRRWHYKVYVPYQIKVRGGYYFGSTKPEGMDLFFIFCPITNIIVSFDTGFHFLSHMGKIKNKDGKTFMEKFFKL